MQKIPNINKTRLHGDSHAKFNSSIGKVLTAAAFSNAKMQILLPVYLNAVRLEMEINSRPLASSHTPGVKELDIRRGAILRQLTGTINRASRGGVPEQIIAGENLWIKVNPFKLSYKRFMTAKTDQISNLIRIINTPKCKKWIEILSLEEIIQKLKDCNDDFNTAYENRSIERHTLVGKGITATEQREVVDKLYMQIIELLNSVVVSTRVGINTGFPEDKMDTVTAKINSFIEQYKLILANMARKRKTKKSEDSRIY